jgi:hypothetical protein
MPGESAKLDVEKMRIFGIHLAGGVFQAKARITRGEFAQSKTES